MMTSLCMMCKYALLLLLSLVDLPQHNVLVTFAATSQQSEVWSEIIDEHGIINTDLIFGSNSHDFTVCSTTRCAAETVRSPALAEKMVIFIVVNDINADPYLYYYLGMIYEYFKGNNIHVLIVSVSHSLPGGPYDYNFMCDIIESCSSLTQQEKMGTINFCEHTLPQLKEDYRLMLSDLYHKKLALVVLHDNILNVNYIGYANQLHREGHDLPILIHLNHEQPWKEPPEVIAMISAVYQVSGLVFRTHHFTDLMSADNVHYLPLGAGTLLTDLLIENLPQSQRRYPATIIEDETQIISNRSFLCSFAGSMKYANRGNAYESSRVEMVEALQDVPGCVFFPTDDASISAPLTQYQYLQLAGSTLFSLCPRGVGPETNRPYQALMMGAVPVMVREEDSDKDFLSAHWHTYPGPVFSSWKEAKDFLLFVSAGEISISEIEALQVEIVEWFKGYQESTRRTIKHLVDTNVHT